MTDNEIRIKVAELQGLNVVGMAHCWAPDGPPWSVLDEDSETSGADDYSPVYIDRAEDKVDPDYRSTLGRACGYDVMYLSRVPAYTTDIAEAWKLVEEMRMSPTLTWIALSMDENESTAQYLQIYPSIDRKTFSDNEACVAICKAYISWKESQDD